MEFLQKIVLKTIRLKFLCLLEIFEASNMTDQDFLVKLQYTNFLFLSFILPASGIKRKGSQYLEKSQVCF